MNAYGLRRAVLSLGVRPLSLCSLRIPACRQHGVGVALVFSGLIARMLWSNRAEVRRAIAGAPKAVSKKKDN